MITDTVVKAGIMVDGIDVLGLEISCGCCGGKFFRLTEKFRAEPPMRGSYLKMLSRYVSWGWYAFPEQDWVVGDNVVCPQCGAPYRLEGVLAQVRKYVNEKLGVVDVKEVPAQIGGADAEHAPQEDELGSTEVDNKCTEEFVRDSTGREEDRSCIAVDMLDNPPDDDDSGIYPVVVGGELNIPMTVMKLTSDGVTQAIIAKTCNISVYMVRQIQNGKKV